MTDSPERRADSLAEHVRTHAAEPVPARDEVPAAPARADGDNVYPEVSGGGVPHSPPAPEASSPHGNLSQQAPAGSDPEADGTPEHPWPQPPEGEKTVITRHGHRATETSAGLWSLDDGSGQPVQVGLGYLVHAHGPFTRP